MKKKLLIIGVFILCLGGALAVYFTSTNGTVKPELKNFAVPDTSDVDKVFLADKNNHEVLLTKETTERWRVNGKYYARRDMLENLMTIIRRVTVRSVVAKAAQENIIKRMSAGSIKVEIYKKGELYKVYYVGSGTQDNMGSFMLLEGSSAPFICFLPGHHGGITNFYMPLENEWRERLIFSYKLQDMAAVTVEYPGDPASSFSLEILGGNEFKLRSLANNKYLPFDTMKVKAYLLEFKNVAFEDFTDVKPEKMDSVRAKHQLFTITVKEKNGTEQWVKGYRLPLPPGLTDDFGNVIPFDEDRMYGDVSHLKEQVILQYYTFDRIVVPISFFKK